MLRYIHLAAITLIVTLAATAAGAVAPCGARSDITALIKDHFGEVEMGRGLSDRGHLMELFVSPAGGWTLLMTNPRGLSCFADAGEAWIMTHPEDRADDGLQLGPELNALSPAEGEVTPNR